MSLVIKIMKSGHIFGIFPLLLLTYYNYKGNGLWMHVDSHIHYLEQKINTWFIQTTFGPDLVQISGLLLYFMSFYFMLFYFTFFLFFHFLLFYVTLSFLYFVLFYLFYFKFVLRYTVLQCTVPQCLNYKVEHYSHMAFGLASSNLWLQNHDADTFFTIFTFFCPHSFFQWVILLILRVICLAAVNVYCLWCLLKTISRTTW